MYCAYIAKIKEIRKHSNADRLQCCEIFGNTVIVDLKYKAGDMVVFFPTDGQLSEEYATDNKLTRSTGGYLDDNKRNITAIKLRGEKSEGLIMPVETLGKYTDISSLKAGDKISILNGHEICKKYIPRSNRRNANSVSNKDNRKPELKVKYPMFFEHTDTQQLAYNESAFKAGDTCYITLKMHGTSGRTANTIQTTKKRRNPVLKKLFGLKDKVSKEYAIVSGTRRTILSNYNGGFYGSNEFRKKWNDFFADKLPKGMEVYYEIVGYTHDSQTIMGKCSNKLVKDKDFSRMYGDETVFSYGCDVGENDIYVYRMTMTNDDGYTVELPWEQVQIEAEKMDAKCVPTFEKFIYTTWDDLMQRVEKYYDGADIIGKTHIREGVVVRIDNRNNFTAYKHKNFYFKCLEGIIKDSSDAPDIEEAEELISEQEN